MKNAIYAMDEHFLAQLLDDRRELYAVARSLGSADEMREARADLMESLDAIFVAPGPGQTPDYDVIDGVARIPIVGELTPKAETDICGGYTANALTEYGYIVAATAEADQDEDVERIEYMIDSPGGYFAGLMDAVAAMREVSKPTTAIVGSMAASAAYWLASQADEIVASSIGSRVGSIGVALEEYDTTQALENAGITRRVYTSTDAPDKRPNTQTEEGQSKVIESLDDIHRVFVRTVAEGRGTDVEDVNTNYGRGSVLIAENALEVGMIDRIVMMEPRKLRTESTLVVDEEQPAAKAEKHKEGVPMNLETLKNEHPAVFAEAVKAGHTEGVESERARVAELRSYIEADPENSRVREVVENAVAEGKAVSDINAKLQVAIRDGGKLDGENPPAVATAGDEMEGLDAEDIEAIRLMGISAAEYKKLNKEVI